MSLVALQKRLDRLERPAHLPGSCLFICQSDVPVTCWRGSCGSIHRSWDIRPGEDDKSFQARVQREALALGIIGLTGFPEEEKNVSA